MRKRSGTVVGGSSTNPPISAGGASPHSRIQNESGGMSGFGNAAADTSSPKPPFGHNLGQPTAAFSSPPEACLPSAEENSAYLLAFERGSVLAAAARIEKGDFAIGRTSKDGGVRATPSPEDVY